MSRTVNDRYVSDLLSLQVRGENIDSTRLNRVMVFDVGNADKIASSKNRYWFCKCNMVQSQSYCLAVNTSPLIVPRSLNECARRNVCGLVGLMYIDPMPIGMAMSRAVAYSLR